MKKIVLIINKPNIWTCIVCLVSHRHKTWEKILYCTRQVRGLREVLEFYRRNAKLFNDEISFKSQQLFGITVLKSFEAKSQENYLERQSCAAPIRYKVLGKWSNDYRKNAKVFNDEISFKSQLFGITVLKSFEANSLEKFSLKDNLVLHPKSTRSSVSARRLQKVRQAIQRRNFSQVTTTIYNRSKSFEAKSLESSLGR